MSGSLHPFESCLRLCVCVSGNESYTDSSCLTLLYVGFLANFLLATEVRHDTLKVAGGFAECGWSFGVVFQTFTEMTSLETNKSHEFHYMTLPLHRVVNHWPKNDSAKFHCYGQKRSEHIHVKRRQLQRRAKPRQKNVFDGTPPRDRDFLVQLAVPSKWRDIQLGLKGLQVRGATLQNLFSRFRACAMRNSFFWGSRGAFWHFRHIIVALSTVLCKCRRFRRWLVVFLHLSNIDSRWEPPWKTSYPLYLCAIST